MIKVTAIFDIGKTNKKLILFDRQLNEVYKDYIQFEEIKDGDGDPCDNLIGIQKWIISSIADITKMKKYRIKEINFSTYGASLVHIDQNGNALTPLYNYTKKIGQSYIDNLYNKHGGVAKISKDTASPPSGMLNSGIQMYWMKYHQPEIYSKIEYSLHLPQYLSYLITRQPISDYTSIGCHTMLWDYTREQYHSWVIKEGIDSKLAPIAHTDKTYVVDYNGQNIKVGAGIHDSSAALLPYLIDNSEPFILISTGTWCVTLNPFSKDGNSTINTEKETLKYMSTMGNGVRASRVFLGNEYKLQVDRLNEYFDRNEDDHKSVAYNNDIYKEIRDANKNQFQFLSLQVDRESEENDLSNYQSFEYAYHQLMYELIKVQIESSNFAIGNTEIKKVYIDGGFIDNEIFIKLLSHYFDNCKLLTASSPIGSALGAALMVSNDIDAADILRNKFKLKEHKPLLFDA